jgi:hypothetical protein
MCLNLTPSPADTFYNLGAHCQAAVNFNHDAKKPSPAGNLRRRFPVVAKSALATAGATTGAPDSHWRFSRRENHYLKAQKWTYLQAPTHLLLWDIISIIVPEYKALGMPRPATSTLPSYD